MRTIAAPIITDKVEKVVDCLMRYNPERIILFGSYARGEADEYSDVDVVVPLRHLPGPQ